MAGLSDQDIAIAAKLRDGKKLTPAELARLQSRRERETRAEWVPCLAPHVADIIRWTEPVWSHTASDANSCAIVPGRRMVTAQVITRDAEKLSLCILSAESNAGTPPTEPLALGDEVRRKITQVATGDCHRLAR